MEIEEETISFEALYLSMLRCKKGVMWKGSVAGFVLHGAERCMALEEALANGTYTPRPTKKFTVHGCGVKPREVVSTPFVDRVYQRSLNDNALYPQIHTQFIYDNMACQKGKGTDLARDRLRSLLRREYINNGADLWVLKCDIKGYYDNMLHEETERIFREALDPWTADRCIEVLRYQYGGDKGYNPGSQMVQIAGIAYLDEVDHYIKERLHAKSYIRYMDDFIIIHKDRDTLERMRNAINTKLGEKGLWLHPSKTNIVRAKDGFTFLGFQFRLTDTGKVLMLVDPKRVKNDRKHLYRIVEKSKRGELPREKADECCRCILNHFSKGNNYKLSKRTEAYYNSLWECEPNEQQRSEDAGICGCESDGG